MVVQFGIARLNRGALGTLAAVTNSSRGDAAGIRIGPIRGQKALFGESKGSVWRTLRPLTLSSRDRNVGIGFRSRPIASEDHRAGAGPG